MAQVVIIGAGHCGKHYWTSTTSRQIARGRATRVSIQDHPCWYWGMCSLTLSESALFSIGLHDKVIGTVAKFAKFLTHYRHNLEGC